MILTSRTLFLLLAVAPASCDKKSIVHENQKGSDAVFLSAVSQFSARASRFSSKGQGGCYVKEEKVHCFGMNDQYQLSLTEMAHSQAPVEVSLNARAIAVASTESETCALTDDGIWCWGAGQADPYSLKGLSGLSQLSGGGDHFCGIDADRRVWCWGNNDFGQSGGSTPDRVKEPVEIPGFDGKITAASAGYHHSCALSLAKEAFCWGRNSSGQLGSQNTMDSYRPVDVRILRGIVSISPGLSHTCALTDDHRVWCWGANDYGQLGSMEAKAGGSLNEVKFGQGVMPVNLSVGGSHSCILDAEQRVYCWGWNLFGQITPQREHIHSPGQVFSNVKADFVLASHYFTLVFDKDKRVIARGLRLGITEEQEDETLRFLEP